jgi:chromosome partitioning protein
VAKVIALVGSKGGSGKTTAAHMLAHGAGSLARPINVVLLTTDPEEQPLQDRRRYLVRDARTKDLLIAELRRLMPVERLLIILDGAAARPDLDMVVQEVADLALLPFRPAAHDAERAAANMTRLPKAVALPTAWPAHPAIRKRAQKWLALLPPDRTMAPWPAIPKLDGFLSPAGYQAATYDLAAPARGLALEVLARAGIDPNDLADPPTAP